MYTVKYGIDMNTFERFANIDGREYQSISKASLKRLDRVCKSQKPGRVSVKHEKNVATTTVTLYW